jgi:mono/diheme cytochrome c family protein
MRSLLLEFVTLVALGCLLLPAAMQAQSDGAKIFKANCELCHGADGSGNTGPGKAFHAQDLRSADTQKETDAQLAEVITKGREKMPAFGAKIKPEDIQKLVAHIRGLAKK